jgi:hypothetical protein
MITIMYDDYRPPLRAARTAGSHGLLKIHFQNLEYLCQ